MDADQGGQSSYEKQRLAAAELARQKVLAAYSSTVNNIPANKSARETLIQNSASQVSRDYSRTRQNEIRTTDTPYNNPDARNNTAQNGIFSPQNNTENTKKHRPVYTKLPDNGVRKKSKFDLKKLFKRKVRDAEEHDLRNSYTAPIENTTAYNPEVNQNYNASATGAMKDIPVNQAAISDEWQKYHSAWQDYYKKYYSEYYAKAAQNYLETEKMKTERLASGKIARQRSLKRLIPAGVFLLVVLGALFLQYNRLIFAPVMAYISPDTGEVTSSITAVDPTVTGAVTADPRLIIPKLNVDVPVAFDIPLGSVDQAMAEGVAQFKIPGASALPGQVGNLVISGHSAGDIYSSNPYKFIFSGLERLEVGDLIYINYQSVRYTYQMTKREVVDPSNVQALIYDTEKPMLTLITCTPLGTSKYRLLITAEQISPSYNPENIAVDDTPEDSSVNMPANEPSFFESLWRNIFGN